MLDAWSVQAQELLLAPVLLASLVLHSLNANLNVLSTRNVPPIWLVSVKNVWILARINVVEMPFVKRSTIIHNVIVRLEWKEILRSSVRLGYEFQSQNVKRTMTAPRTELVSIRNVLTLALDRAHRKLNVAFSTIALSAHALMDTLEIHKSIVIHVSFNFVCHGHLLKELVLIPSHFYSWLPE